MASRTPRGRGPPPSTWRCRTPYLVLCAMLVWVFALLFMLCRHSDSMCPSCVQMPINMLGNMMKTPNPMGLRFRVKYVKSRTDPEAGSWTLASTVPRSGGGTANPEPQRRGNEGLSGVPGAKPYSRAGNPTTRRSGHSQRFAAVSDTKTIVDSSLGFTTLRGADDAVRNPKEEAAGQLASAGSRLRRDMGENPGALAVSLGGLGSKVDTGVRFLSRRDHGKDAILQEDAQTRAQVLFRSDKGGTANLEEIADPRSVLLSKRDQGGHAGLEGNAKEPSGGAPRARGADTESAAALRLAQRWDALLKGAGNAAKPHDDAIEQLKHESQDRALAVGQAARVSAAGVVEGRSDPVRLQVSKTGAGDRSSGFKLSIHNDPSIKAAGSGRQDGSQGAVLEQRHFQVAMERVINQTAYHTISRPLQIPEELPAPHNPTNSSDANPGAKAGKPARTLPSSSQKPSGVVAPAETLLRKTVAGRGSAVEAAAEAIPLLSTAVAEREREGELARAAELVANPNIGSRGTGLVAPRVHRSGPVDETGHLGLAKPDAGHALAANPSSDGVQVDPDRAPGGVRDPKRGIVTPLSANDIARLLDQAAEETHPPLLNQATEKPSAPLLNQAVGETDPLLLDQATAKPSALSLNQAIGETSAPLEAVPVSTNPTAPTQAADQTLAEAFRRGAALDRSAKPGSLSASQIMEQWHKFPKVLQVKESADKAIRLAEELNRGQEGTPPPPFEWGDSAPPPPDGPQTPLQRATRPVHVSLVTGHFFGPDYVRVVPDCSYEGLPLHCQFHSDHSDAVTWAADALWYHIPTFMVAPYDGQYKRRPEQLAVAMSMESAAYYRTLEVPEIMDKFDVEMTYRKQSQVMVPYFQPSYLEEWEASPPVPVEDKLNAIVYINSNCAALSGRAAIMAAIMENGTFPVHSFGSCDNNKGPTGPRRKIDIFRQYKFCVCMENSVTTSYVTEKIYDGLVAGCLPIYYGAPDIADFVPDVNGIVDFRDFGSPALLLEEIVRLSKDDDAYNAKFAWRTRPKDMWSPGFRALMERAAPPHTQCRLCQHVVQHRLNMSTGVVPVTKSRRTLLRL